MPHRISASCPGPRPAAAFLGLLVAAFLAPTAGCTFDSWMDPSVVGRWEDTPAEAPILDRLDVIESVPDDYLQTTSVRPEDLVPEIEPYVIGPGDRLRISVEDLYGPGQNLEVQRFVDETGRLAVPVAGVVPAAGRTEAEVQTAILEALYDKRIFRPSTPNPPEIIVIAENRQQNSYSVIGQVASPGRYVIPEPRFHLLDAVATAGGIPETAERLFVIRQIPLDEVVLRGWSGDADRPALDGGAGEAGDRGPADAGEGMPADEDDLDRLLEDLLGPGEGGSNDAADADADVDRQPATGDGDEAAERSAGGADGSAADAIGPGLEVPDRDDGRWIYLDGRWIRVDVSDPAAGEEGVGPVVRPGGSVFPDAERLVTQRVIEVPVDALLDGDARYNIIVRPGDIVRVPAALRGLIYIDGQIARPGSFTLPDTGRLTLTRAITTAGGLGPLAIPERVDITRMVGPNRQATVRLNLRAINEMTEPDIYLKPDDRINVGTTWYAAPLAVIRNGFRTTYGFGFLLDRNFGNDVFGAPPVNRGVR